MHSFSVRLPNLPLGCTLPSDVEELLLASAKPVLILANKLRLRCSALQLENFFLLSVGPHERILPSLFDDVQRAETLST